jgi:myo-inositol 2-dehydrogenase / D-chiro-inositol 1-dehydrogenase
LREVNDIDTAIVVLQHENGAMSTIDNSRQAVYGYDQRVEAFGSKGMASSSNPPAHSGSVMTASGELRAPCQHFFLERYMTSYEVEWSAFIDAVREGEPSPTSVSDARAPLVIGRAAQRSLAQGRAVSISEIDELQTLS